MENTDTIMEMIITCSNEIPENNSKLSLIFRAFGQGTIIIGLCVAEPKPHHFDGTGSGAVTRFGSEPWLFNIKGFKMTIYNFTIHIFHSIIHIPEIK
jgi:hypothetical protein